jgi:hypothetical protein
VVVVVGAIPASLPLGRDILAVEATLQQAAASVHADFIDPIAQTWITLSNEHQNSGPVPEHPGNLGHTYLAQRLADDLRTVLPASLTRPASPAVGDDQGVTYSTIG